MAASLDTLEAEVKATNALMAAGFDAVNSRLDKVNGRLDANGKQIADNCTDLARHDERIEDVEAAQQAVGQSWRTLLVQVCGAVILYVLFQIMPKVLTVAAKAAG